ncbi:MAG: biotin--[acetyl-CoA-carboxylase] ligase [Thermomicrobiales bacterium]
MISESDWKLHHYAAVASTMDPAAALARFGANEGTVVVSDVQTAGRGRGGRKWQAPPGSGLFCTIILRPDVSPNRLGVLPLVLANAVADAVEAVADLPVRLKWPNDIWLGDDPEQQKVAGILTTSRLVGDRIDYVLAGIGINLSTRRADLPPGGASLLAVTGSAPATAAMARQLLACIGEEYGNYLGALGRPSLDRWRKRAALIGEQVSIQTNDREWIGRFVDIDADGALLLDEPESGIRRYVAGDLIRGPRGLNAPGIRPTEGATSDSNHARLKDRSTPSW